MKNDKCLTQREKAAIKEYWVSPSENYFVKRLIANGFLKVPFEKEYGKRQ